MTREKLLAGAVGLVGAALGFAFGLGAAADDRDRAVADTVERYERLLDEYEALEASYQKTVGLQRESIDLLKRQVRIEKARRRP